VLDNLRTSAILGMRGLDRACTMRAWITRPPLSVSERKKHTALSEVYNFGIFYHQLIVFDESTAPVPNDWREQHVAQGFSWRPGTVSFATLGDFGDLRVEVRVADNLDVLPEAVRAVVVPFAVLPPGRVGLSDTVDDVTTRVPPGHYALLCEIGYLSEKEGEEAEWCQLTFAPRRDVQPEILLRADELLSPQYPLMTEADPVWMPS